MPRGRESGEGYARKVAAKQKVRERSVEKCEIFHIKWGKMKASFVSVSVCGESHLLSKLKSGRDRGCSANSATELPDC